MSVGILYRMAAVRAPGIVSVAIIKNAPTGSPRKLENHSRILMVVILPVISLIIAQSTQEITKLPWVVAVPPYWTKFVLMAMIVAIAGRRFFRSPQERGFCLAGQQSTSVRQLEAEDSGKEKVVVDRPLGLVVDPLGDSFVGLDGDATQSPRRPQLPEGRS